MKPYLHKTSFGQLELDLHNAIEFLQKYEIEINKTRIDKYKKDLEEFINIYRTKNFEKLRDTKFQQRIADSLFESADWIRKRRSSVECGPKSPKDRVFEGLRKVRLDHRGPFQTAVDCIYRALIGHSQDGAPDPQIPCAPAFFGD